MYIIHYTSLQLVSIVSFVTIGGMVAYYHTSLQLVSIVSFVAVSEVVAYYFTSLQLVSIVSFVTIGMVLALEWNGFLLSYVTTARFHCQFCHHRWNGSRKSLGFGQATRAIMGKSIAPITASLRRGFVILMTHHSKPLYNRRKMANIDVYQLLGIKGNSSQTGCPSFIFHPSVHPSVALLQKNYSIFEE